MGDQLVQSQVSGSLNLISLASRPPQPKLSFLNLPTEIRIMIYEVLLTQQCVIMDVRLHGGDNIDHGRSLSAVNRQIRSEVRPLIYQQIQLGANIPSIRACRDFVILAKSTDILPFLRDLTIVIRESDLCILCSGTEKSQENLQIWTAALRTIRQMSSGLDTLFIDTCFCREDCAAAALVFMYGPEIHPMYSLSQSKELLNELASFDKVADFTIEWNMPKCYVNSIWQRTAARITSFSLPRSRLV